MKALTTRKPISLTTTSMCSGPFAARIARSQRLRELRVAAVPGGTWERAAAAVDAGLFKTYGLDVRTTIVADGAAALAALSGGAADVAFADTVTAIRAHADHPSLQFVAIGAGTDEAYVALAAAIDAKRYAMSRFARALRANAFAGYADERELQALLDRLAAEKTIGATIPAHDLISRVAEMSGTR